MTIFFVLVVAILSYQLYEYRLLNKIAERVRWCVFIDPHNCHYFSDLTNTVNRCAPEAYRITDDDRSAFKKIHDKYKEYAASFLCHDDGKYAKYYVKLSNEEFFMITFMQFLSKNECAEKFCGETMYEFKSRVDEHTKEYTLTDFGVLYLKTHLDTLLFVAELNTPIITDSSLLTRKAKAIMKEIDKRVISIETFDPRDEV